MENCLTQKDMVIVFIYIAISVGMHIFALYYMLSLRNLIKTELDKIVDDKVLRNIHGKLAEIYKLSADKNDAAVISAITRRVALLVMIENIKHFIPKGHELNEPDLTVMFEESFNNALVNYVQSIDSTKNGKEQQEEHE